MDRELQRQIIIRFYRKFGWTGPFGIGKWMCPEYSVIESAEEMVEVVFRVNDRIPKKIKLMVPASIIVTGVIMGVILGIIGGIYFPYPNWSGQNPLLILSIAAGTILSAAIVAGIATLMFIRGKVRHTTRIVMNDMGYSLCMHCGASRADGEFDESGGKGCPNCGTPIL